MNTPFHVGRPNIYDVDDFLARARDILQSGWLTNNGVNVLALEAELCARLEVRHVVSTANATVGLQILLKALLGETSGDVIVPAFTFVATAQAPRWLGLEPVFADVDPATHCLSAADVARRVTSRTRAILGVHLWGTCCDIEGLSAVAEEAGIPLIFDAAHAFACRRDETFVGNFGAGEVFSFHATKVFNTFEGGAIATNDTDLADRCRLIRNFGFSGVDRIECLGTNGKMSEICAAMGLVNLRGVDGFIVVNRAHLDVYRQELSDIRGLSLYEWASGSTSNYQYAVVELESGSFGRSRDEVVSALTAQGIFARRYFAPGLNRVPPFGPKDAPKDLSLPVSEALARNVIVLPTGPSMSENDVRGVCRAVRSLSRD